MNIFKKIYKKIFGEKPTAEDKEQECWYNNAHENGEATHCEGCAPSGGENSFEVGNAKKSRKPM